MIELRTLGALELTSADGKPLRSVLTQPRRAALLCYLAVASPKGFQRRDSVLAIFWPEDDAEQARHALRQALYFLRHTLGAAAIVSRGDDELAVSTDLIRCDATEFERALDAGRLRDALSLYRGDLLPAFHVADAPGFERWLDAERSRLERRAADAAWALAVERERASDPTGAAEWGERAVSLAAGDEVALRRLLSLLHRLGNRAAAVRAYDAFARELEREYELAPSEATRALLARIRSEQSEQSAAISVGASAPSPAAQPNGDEPGDPPHPLPEPERRVSSPEMSDSHLSAFGQLPPVSDPRANAAQRPSKARRWRRSLGVGIATIVLGGVLAMSARWLGAHPRAALPTRRADRIVVADFNNRTSDSTFGDLVAHVLDAELAQSSILRVVGRETIARAMLRMRRNADERLTPELARDLATREGITLVLEGEARSAGSKVMLTASVIEIASGDVIAGAVESVNDSTDVLAAIGRLAGRLRQGIGESSASIQSADTLWSLTTSSLPALRKRVAASRAFWRGDYQTAVSLLTEATALDPEFADAHLFLWVALEASGDTHGRAMRSLVRAYQLRDRLTERERYAVEANYFLAVVGDVQKAIVAFRKHIDALHKLPAGEPGSYASLGNVLAMTGDLEGAERVLEESRVRHPTPENQGGLVSVLHEEGKDGEIPAVLAEIARRQPEHPYITTLRVRLLADSGRYDAAHAIASQPGSQPANRLQLQAEMDAVRGRIGEAVGHLGEVRDQALSSGQLASAVDAAVAIGRLRALSGDTAGAVAEVAGLLARHPIDSLDALSRPYLTLAAFYGDMGQPQRGRAWLAAYEREVPREFRGPDQHALHETRAAVRRAEGNFAQALAELRTAARLPAARTSFMDERISLSDHPALARVYDALGSSDSAIAVYERYLSVRSLSRTALDAVELGNALERLGALYEARGDKARAAEQYARLADLWSEADAPLRRRAEVAARRAHTLVARKAQGTIVTDSVSSPGLASNVVGDSPVRPTLVYLPPSYQRDLTRRYPVLYLLHGTTSLPKEWVDGTYQGLDLRIALDSLIGAAAIPELIVVMPDANNALEASFYANSPATGNWEDFVVRDLVGHVDRRYRTDARASKRALVGHSMGGFGALNIGFNHPDVFGFVYAISPCCLGFTGRMDRQAPGWGALARIKRWQDTPGQARLLLGTAAALDGSSTDPRLFTELPFDLTTDGTVVPNPAVQARWRARMPPDRASAMVRRGDRQPVIVIESGSEETDLRLGIALLRSRLDSLRVRYADTTFTGGHIDRVRERFTQHMLPTVGKWLGQRP